jgi:hypothetical protein
MNAVEVRTRPRMRGVAARSSPLALAARHPAALLAAILAGAWMLVYPRTPDLAAQAYRVQLFHGSGFAVWDNNWYAGHHVPGYSLLFPPLAGVLGLRLLGALAVIASALLFSVLVDERWGRGARAAGMWFAVAAAGDLWIGRITFALGAMLGLAAVLAAVRGRTLACALLGAACAAASPVAGLFLVLGGVAHALTGGTVRRAAALAVPALAVALALAALFPEGGRQPFATTSFLATIAAALAFLALAGLAGLAGREQRLLRVGGALYVAAVVLSLLVSTPMGSNVARLAILFAGPLLICAASSRGAQPWNGWRGGALAVALVGLGAWTLFGPVRELRKVSGDPSVTAAYYRPVAAFLGAHLRAPARVEVPFTRSHWEATLLGGHVALARGWERQLDTRYDRLFFAGALTAAAYRAWLSQTAVRYVALPDARLDVSSVAEARLIRSGLPFLRPVWSDAHWRVYQVDGAQPMASGPGELTALPRDGFELRADRPGRFIVRVRYTRYWAVTRGAACVSRAADGWTAVAAHRRGMLGVTARFSLGRALGGGPSCAALRT